MRICRRISGGRVRKEGGVGEAMGNASALRLLSGDGVLSRADGTMMLGRDVIYTDTQTNK